MVGSHRKCHDPIAETLLLQKPRIPLRVKKMAPAAVGTIRMICSMNFLYRDLSI